ncbi:MAG: class I SAM-dependent RNA methyltransferase [Acidobacteria bacterium]|nr:class I SAM-dependent RNA methyltransferase [Acidobacteriota bacterium]
MTKPGPFRIEKLVHGGSGMGRLNGRVVFAPWTAPGDLVSLESWQEKKDYFHAERVRVVEPSSERRAAPCPHFGVCGGCHWQHLKYDSQARWKREIFRETLLRALGEEFPFDLIPSPEWGYRRRVRLQIGRAAGNNFLGFFRGGTHEPFRVEECGVLTGPLQELLPRLQQWIHAVPVSLRGSELEALQCDDRTLVRVEVGTQKQLAALQKRLSFWDLGGTVLSVGRGAGQASSSAAAAITVGGFRYRVSPGTFFQANAHLTEELVRSVLDQLRGRGKPVLELYSGAGLFTVPVASSGREVVAIEEDPVACADARWNLRVAGVSDAAVVCEKADRWLARQPPAEVGRFESVLLDPPRTGLGPAVLQQVLKLQACHIIYVSCDPATLARDLRRFRQGGYRLARLRAFDFFPQTYHLEAIAALERSA